MRILFVASECAPYAKTGGLGDVIAALPKALRRLSHDVRVILPLYASIPRALHGVTFDGSACVHMGNGEENWIGLHSSKLDNEVPIWFVEYDRFYGRPGIYGDALGEYSDNAFRYALLCKAALQICKDRDFIPDVLHAHDWQSSLSALYLKTWDRILSPLSRTASVLTIHNIGYQGIYHANAFSYIGIGYEYFNPNCLEDHGNLNLLKSGIFFADALTTVSPTHAREILEPIGGCGLAPHLNRRRHDLSGILNGVDTDHWNPSTDHLLPARYTPDRLAGKAVCKRALQEYFFLNPQTEIPIFGIVSRFAQQKGFDLLREALPKALRQMSFQVAVLGSGDPSIENFFRWLSSIYPGRVGVFIGYSNDLSHLIEAGSDFFLMPSLYEPCGLNQMYSLKYGTLPIVRSTGGLNDTVENYDETTERGTGFKFDLPDAQALTNTIGWAVSTWFDRPTHIANLQQNAMRQNFPWSDTATAYEKVYARAIAKRRGE